MEFSERLTAVKSKLIDQNPFRDMAGDVHVSKSDKDSV